MIRSSLLTAAVLAAGMFADSAPTKELKLIPLKQVRANPVALRAVDKDTEKYKGLVASVQQVGVLNAITVRAKTDPETKDPYYEIIDGLHRYTSSLDAGSDKDGNPITMIPAQILTLTDAATLEAQIIGNIHTVETQGTEYSNQLVRILKANATMTEAELSARLGKSPSWVSERLGLLKLIPEAATLVNEGKITLTNAYALAKLPKEEQPEWLVRAQTLPPDQFTAGALNRKKELDKARRAGQSTEEETFSPVPHLRKLADLKEEMEHPVQIAALITKYAPNSPADAAALALKWALNMDPESLATREDTWNAEKKQRDADRAARAVETKEKRAKEARERADKVTKEAQELREKNGTATA